MEENKQEKNKTEQNKYISLFDRIKENILRKNKEEFSSETSDDSQTVSEEADDEPQGRGVISVAEDSLLFSLWSEWKAAADRAEAEAETEEEADEREEFESIEPFELVAEAADTQEIPMSTEEIEKEKQRATVQLMMKAEKYQQLTKPNEEGISATLDAYLVIHVAQSRMAAWAFAFPPSGEGKPLERSQIYMTLHEYSVSAGIDHSAVEYLVREQPYFKLVPIAYGEPMISGKNGSVEEKFKRKVEKTFAVNERGDVDYRVQNYIQTIHAGDVICQAIPPTMGTDGFDVLGSVIPAKHGEAARLVTGQNTALSEDKMQVTATLDGHLVYESGKFSVKPLFYVRGDVDLRVGNIDFLGDVHITGDVRDDFVVHATGTITVDGLVEGAMIEAGKDVFIAKGILGDEKAVIKAGGNVQTEYIENCMIYAGDTVRAGSIISSYVYCDNQILVNAGRGTIIGGKPVAASLIEAKIIGCRTERPTALVIGEMPYVQEQKEEIAQSLQKIAEEKEKIDRIINSFDQYMEEMDPEQVQTVMKCRLQKSVLAMQETHLQKQLAEFEDRTVELPDCKIIANTVYPITRVKIRDYSYTIDEKTMSCRIHIGEDTIKLL